MRNKLMLLVSILSLCVFLTHGQRVEAGVIFAFAEAAQFTTDSTGCVKTNTAPFADGEPDPGGTATANTVVLCDETTSNGEFVIPIPIPKDVPSSPTVSCTIVYFHPVGTSLVAWDVKVHSYRSTANRDSVDPTPANVDSTSRAHNNISQVYYTQTTTGIPIYDVLAGADCSGTNCNGTYGNIHIKFDDATSSTNLYAEFRMAIIEY